MKSSSPQNHTFTPRDCINETYGMGNVDNQKLRDTMVENWDQEYSSAYPIHAEIREHVNENILIQLNDPDSLRQQLHQRDVYSLLPIHYAFIYDNLDLLDGYYKHYIEPNNAKYFSEKPDAWPFNDGNMIRLALHFYARAILNFPEDKRRMACSLALQFIRIQVRYALDNDLPVGIAFPIEELYGQQRKAFQSLDPTKIQGKIVELDKFYDAVIGNIATCIQSLCGSTPPQKNLSERFLKLVTTKEASFCFNIDENSILVRAVLYGRSSFEKTSYIFDHIFIAQRFIFFLNKNKESLLTTYILEGDTEALALVREHIPTFYLWHFFFQQSQRIRQQLLPLLLEVTTLHDLHYGLEKEESVFHRLLKDGNIETLRTLVSKHKEMYSIAALLAPTDDKKETTEEATHEDVEPLLAAGSLLTPHPITLRNYFYLSPGDCIDLTWTKVNFWPNFFMSKPLAESPNDHLKHRSYPILHHWPKHYVDHYPKHAAAQLGIRVELHQKHAIEPDPFVLLPIHYAFLGYHLDVAEDYINFYIKDDEVKDPNLEPLLSPYLGDFLPAIAVRMARHFCTEQDDIGTKERACKLAIQVVEKQFVLSKVGKCSWLLKLDDVLAISADLGDEHPARELRKLLFKPIIVALMSKTSAQSEKAYQLFRDFQLDEAGFKGQKLDLQDHQVMTAFDITMSHLKPHNNLSDFSKRFYDTLAILYLKNHAGQTLLDRCIAQPKDLLVKSLLEECGAFLTSEFQYNDVNFSDPKHTNLARSLITHLTPAMIKKGFKSSTSLLHQLPQLTFLNHGVALLLKAELSCHEGFALFSYYEKVACHQDIKDNLAIILFDCLFGQYLEQDTKENSYRLRFDIFRLYMEMDKSDGMVNITPQQKKNTVVTLLSRFSSQSLLNMSEKQLLENFFQIFPITYSVDVKKSKKKVKPTPKRQAVLEDPDILCRNDEIGSYCPTPSSEMLNVFLNGRYFPSIDFLYPGRVLESGSDNSYLAMIGDIRGITNLLQQDQWKVMPLEYIMLFVQYQHIEVIKNRLKTGFSKCNSKEAFVIMLTHYAYFAPDPYLEQTRTLLTDALTMFFDEKKKNKKTGQAAIRETVNRLISFLLPLTEDEVYQESLLQHFVTFCCSPAYAGLLFDGTLPSGHTPRLLGYALVLEALSDTRREVFAEKVIALCKGRQGKPSGFEKIIASWDFSTIQDYRAQLAWVQLIDEPFTVQDRRTTLLEEALRARINKDKLFEVLEILIEDFLATPFISRDAEIRPVIEMLLGNQSIRRSLEERHWFLFYNCLGFEPYALAFLELSSTMRYDELHRDVMLLTEVVTKASNNPQDYQDFLTYAKPVYSPEVHKSKFSESGEWPIPILPVHASSSSDDLSGMESSSEIVQIVKTGELVKLFSYCLTHPQASDEDFIASVTIAIPKFRFDLIYLLGVWKRASVAWIKGSAPSSPITIEQFKRALLEQQTIIVAQGFFTSAEARSLIRSDPGFCAQLFSLGIREFENGLNQQSIAFLAFIVILREDPTFLDLLTQAIRQEHLKDPESFLLDLLAASYVDLFAHYFPLINKAPMDKDSIRSWSSLVASAIRFQHNLSLKEILSKYQPTRLKETANENGREEIVAVRLRGDPDYQEGAIRVSSTEFSAVRSGASISPSIQLVTLLKSGNINHIFQHFINHSKPTVEEFAEYKKVLLITNPHPDIIYLLKAWHRQAASWIQKTAPEAFSLTVEELQNALANGHHSFVAHYFLRDNKVVRRILLENRDICTGLLDLGTKEYLENKQNDSIAYLIFSMTLREDPSLLETIACCIRECKISEPGSLLINLLKTTDQALLHHYVPHISIESLTSQQIEVWSRIVGMDIQFKAQHSVRQIMHFHAITHFRVLPNDQTCPDKILKELITPHAWSKLLMHSIDIAIQPIQDTTYPQCPDLLHQEFIVRLMKGILLGESIKKPQDQHLKLGIMLCSYLMLAKQDQEADGVTLLQKFLTPTARHALVDIMTKLAVLLKGRPLIGPETFLQSISLIDPDRLFAFLIKLEPSLYQFQLPGFTSVNQLQSFYRNLEKHLSGLAKGVLEDVMNLKESFTKLQDTEAYQFCFQSFQEFTFLCSLLETLNTEEELKRPPLGMEGNRKQLPCMMDWVVQKGSIFLFSWCVHEIGANATVHGQTWLSTIRKFKLDAKDIWLKRNFPELYKVDIRSVDEWLKIIEPTKKKPKEKVSPKKTPPLKPKASANTKPSRAERAPSPTPEAIKKLQVDPVASLTLPLASEEIKKTSEDTVPSSTKEEKKRLKKEAKQLRRKEKNAAYKQQKEKEREPEQTIRKIAPHPKVASNHEAKKVTPAQQPKKSTALDTVLKKEVAEKSSTSTKQPKKDLSTATQKVEGNMHIPYPQPKSYVPAPTTNPSAEQAFSINDPIVALQKETSKHKRKITSLGSLEDCLTKIALSVRKGSSREEQAIFYEQSLRALVHNPDNSPVWAVDPRTKQELENFIANKLRQLSFTIGSVGMKVQQTPSVFIACGLLGYLNTKEKNGDLHIIPFSYMREALFSYDFSNDLHIRLHGDITAIRSSNTSPLIS